MALLLSLWGLGSAVYAAAVTVFLLMLMADLGMVGALVTHDVSLVYVAENNARATPLFYSAILL